MANQAQISFPLAGKRIAFESLNGHKQAGKPVNGAPPGPDETAMAQRAKIGMTDGASGRVIQSQEMRHFASPSSGCDDPEGKDLATARQCDTVLTENFNFSKPFLQPCGGGQRNHPLAQLK